MVGGSSSECFGSHDSQRAHDESNAGGGFAGRVQRPIGVSWVDAVRDEKVTTARWPRGRGFRDGLWDG